MQDRMERARPNEGRLSGSILLLALSVAACAGSQEAAPEVARKPPPAPQKLAWMPLDAFDAPTVAQAVNDRLGTIKPSGTAASIKAAVSMEVAQLAIECIEPTPACYGAVGRSLGADRLMWAVLEPAADDEKIRVTVMVFDVQAGTAPRRVGETFAGVQAARAGVAGLVDRAATPEKRTP
jgi:hypothetical protein